MSFFVEAEDYFWGWISNLLLLLLSPCSLQGLLFNISIQSICLFLKTLDGWWVDVTFMSMENLTACIAFVFDFHFGEFADIDVASKGSSCSNSFGDIHIDIKSLVSFVLAVAHASFFFIAFSYSEFIVNAILLAFREEDRWQRAAH